MTETEWQYYPKSDSIPTHLIKVIGIFKKHEVRIRSSSEKLHSNEVLSVLRIGLLNNGFVVEKSKLKKDTIKVPVLFGRNGTLEKYFEADAYNKKTKTVLEVEAGRGVMNNQFLKDLFQACMMHDTDYFVIAIRKKYLRSNDFAEVVAFFDALYAGRRLMLPLKGILVIGY